MKIVLLLNNCITRTVQQMNPTDIIETPRNNMLHLDFELCSKRLINVMNSMYNHTFNTDGIIDVMNDFLFLSKYHNGEKDFEYIYTQIGGECPLNDCHGFRRNNRDGTTCGCVQSQYNTTEYQLLDKIHCFYAHSYDM
eukprot:669632_1